MDARRFAEACYREKELSLKLYFEEESSAVYEKIKQLDLTEDKLETLKELMDIALTDTFYTMLLALDGEANLGNCFQEKFKITCEDSSVISECGELEAAAYEAFYSH